MTLSIFETFAILASWFGIVWMFFTFTYWLDKRAIRKKEREEWNKMAFTSKLKHTGNAVAKTNVGKAVSGGAKKVVAPVVSAANKAADIATQTVEGAMKGATTVSDAAKSVAKQKAVKKVAQKAKAAGNKVRVVGGKVKDFFRVEPIDDDDKDDED